MVAIMYISKKEKSIYMIWRTTKRPPFPRRHLFLLLMQNTHIHMSTHRMVWLVGVKMGKGLF